jgi:hypothetical protein
MFDRRQFLLALAAAAAAPAAAVAKSGFQPFLPLLIDLPGWEGGKPEGFAMDAGGHAMTTASRKYSRDSAHVEAVIATGAAAQGALGALAANMSMETSEGHAQTGAENGFRMLKTFRAADNSGAIMIALADAAMFNFTYSGLSEDEALALARKFDWNAMKAAAAA